MIRALILLAALSGQLRTPPSGWCDSPQTVPPTSVVVAAPVRRALVVVVTMNGCPPCKTTKANLAPLANRRDVEYIVEDVASWNARVNPSLRCHSLPTVYAWPDGTSNTGAGKWVGIVKLQQVEKAIKRIVAVPNESAHLRGRPTASGAFISINGSVAGATHEVSLPGREVYLVSPNTEQGWREHLQYHGYRNFETMSAQELALAHINAHGG